MNLSPLRTRLASLLCAGLVAFAITGCGGGDDDSSEPAQSSPTQAEMGIESADDRKAVATFIQKFIRSTKAGDASKFCGLFEPSAVKETFGNAGRCVTFFGPLLKQKEVRNQYEIGNLDFDGDQATITFKGDQGTGALVKVDGQWYIEIPKELTAQVKAAK